MSDLFGNHVFPTRRLISQDVAHTSGNLVIHNKAHMTIEED